jgi:hypothetical protein
MTLDLRQYVRMTNVTISYTNTGTVPIRTLERCYVVGVTSASDKQQQQTTTTIYQIKYLPIDQVELSL